MDIDDKVFGGIIVATITAVGAWLGGMRHGRAEFINAVQSAADLVMKQMREELQRLGARCERAERSHEECQSTLTEVRAQVNELMRGPIANYGDKPPQ